MAQVSSKSPYTTEGAEDELGYAVPQSAEFAAPSLTAENGWVDEPGLGYAPSHRMPVGIRRDFRPDPARPPGEFWDAQNDVMERHAVEDQDADGFTEHKEGSGKPFAPHASSIRPAEPRPTGHMSPHTYHFTRPFDQHLARRFNGLHFSMADHRRDYDIGGMAPGIRARSNTYRIEPTPWDADIVVTAAPAEQLQARTQAVDIQPSGDRSHRLI